jgi:hypothetical protein
LTPAKKYFSKFCVLGYNIVQYVESQPNFRRNLLPPSSGPKTKPRNQHKAGRNDVDICTYVRSEVSRVVTMKNVLFGMWRCVDLALADVSEERIASIFKIEKSANGEPASAGEDGGDTFLRNVG